MLKLIGICLFEAAYNQRLLLALKCVMLEYELFNSMCFLRLNIGFNEEESRDLAELLRDTFRTSHQKNAEVNFQI